jgi:hypothetical protein
VKFHIPGGVLLGWDFGFDQEAEETEQAYSGDRRFERDSKRRRGRNRRKLRQPASGVSRDSPE